MRLVIITAFIAVCGAAKLNRGYLPPPSAQTAGGSPGAIQTPFSADASPSQRNQGLGDVPKGAYNNDFQGVVVDAAASGTRGTEIEESGLGAPRVSYGSQNSKVGDAAFESAPTAADFRGQFASANTQNQQENLVNGQFADTFTQNQQENGVNEQYNGQQTGIQVGQRFGQQSFAAQPAQPERANAEQDRRAGIIRYENEVGTDTFNYAFETDNGIKAEESGVATNGVQAQGGFSYVADDGQTYSVTYTADENGYKPVGSHLPTPPPIPKEIQQALEKNAKDEAAGLRDDGSYDAKRYNAGNDYNESDNINGQYNRVQSNKGFENIDAASDTTSSGTFIQNSAQPLNQPQLNSINADGTVKLNELEEKYKKQSGVLIINRFNRPFPDFGNAGTSAQVSATAPSNNAFERLSNFGQSSQSIIPVENNNNAFSQSSSGNNAIDQSTFGNNQIFSQQQQTQSPGFGTQKLGYLPPVQGSPVSNNNRLSSFPSSPTQQFGQASSQQTSQKFVNVQPFTQQQSTVQPTVSQPSPTLSTPFTQAVTNTVQTQNRFQEQTPSFSKDPTPTSAAPSTQQNDGFGCCGKRPDQPSSIRPASQGYRQQTLPQQANNNVAQTQSTRSTSSFASFNSQTNSPTNNFNDIAASSQRFESQPQPMRQPIGQQKQEVNLQNRFNQNTQSSAQFSTTTQRPFNQNTFAEQQSSVSSSNLAQDNSYYYKQPAQPFRVPNRQSQQNTNNIPSIPSIQFNKVMPQSSSSQINSLTSSQQNFQATQSRFGNEQQSTRYPRPPTFTSSAAAVPSSQETKAPQSTFQTQQYNGVTQASASSFSSPTPSIQFNTQPQQLSKRPMRPSFQQQQLASRSNVQDQSQTQVNTQAQPQTTFQRPLPTPAIPKQITTISQSFPKPTFAPNQFDQNANSFQQQSLNFGQRQSFTQQFQLQTSAEPSTESVPTQQYDGEIYEYNKPAESLPPPDSTPASVEQTLATEAPEQNNLQTTQTAGTIQNQFGLRPTTNSVPQFGAVQNRFGTQQNQLSAQGNQFGAQQNQFRNNQNQLGTQQNQFGSQFLGAQQSSSPVAGQGEVFGGARQPPRFDSNTGYHY